MIGVKDGVMGDSIPFVSLSVGTGTERPAPQAPQTRSRSRHQAHPAPDLDPGPVPASGAPSHLFSYELSQPLQSPCPCFRQIFYNGQCLCHYQVAHDGAGKKGSGAGAL